LPSPPLLPFCAQDIAGVCPRLSLKLPGSPGNSYPDLRERIKKLIKLNSQHHSEYLLLILKEINILVTLAKWKVAGRARIKCKTGISKE
jgi:hypothetical protein